MNRSFLTLFRARLYGAAVVAALAAVPLMPAQAASFDIGDTTISVDNLFTVGAAWRMQDRHSSQISKSNLHKLLYGPDAALCVGRVGDDGVSGPSTDGNNQFYGDTCTTSAANPDDPDHPNQRFVRAPGNYGPNGDDPNLSFDRYDLTQATAKLTTDWSFDIGPVSFFFRTLAYYDDVYMDFEETNSDTTLSPRHESWSRAGRKSLGMDLKLLDAYASTWLPFIGDRELSVKVGKQVINWGESALLLLNSLNTINPVSQNRLNTPGFDLKELSIPLGMVFLQTDLTYNASLEMFYQYEWEPLDIAPAGSWNSAGDHITPGAEWGMLSFGKAPEDPLGLYEPRLNTSGHPTETGEAGPGGTPYSGTDPIGTLQSSASRTIYRDFDEERRRRPDDGGQYGAAVKLFLEDFNNGTELAFYFANYHSRVPSISQLAADETCIGQSGISANPVTNLTNLLVDCQYVSDPAAAAAALPGILATQSLPEPAIEPVPVDTLKLVVEYPENIRMWGTSFNTTIGDWALAGEYSFRENLPIQVAGIDLSFAGLQPAFPEEDYDVGVAVIPGRRSTVPDFLETNYRGRPASERLAAGEQNYYVQGWERQKIGQAIATLLKTIGGDNPLGAAQIILLFELGYVHLPDFPDPCTELAFNGAGTNLHISHGADGTTGCAAADTQVDGETADQTAQDDDRQRLRQNPTAEDFSRFPTEESYGYRFINLNRFDNVLFGANLETLFIARHDVYGIGPGLGQNFIEGRKQFDLGLRWDYLSRFIGEVRYTWFTGGNRNGQKDQDSAFVYLGYQF